MKCSLAVRAEVPLAPTESEAYGMFLTAGLELRGQSSSYRTGAVRDGLTDGAAENETHPEPGASMLNSSSFVPAALR